MTITEKMEYLKTKLLEIDNELLIGQGTQTKPDAIGFWFGREVEQGDNLHKILQPPYIEDTIRNLLGEVCGDTDVEFTIKHWPEPVPDGRTRGYVPPFSTTGETVGAGRQIRKPGGWEHGPRHFGEPRQWTKVSVTHRKLYEVTVWFRVAPIFAEAKLMKIIERALKDGSWAMRESHLDNKHTSRLYIPGERVVRFERHKKTKVGQIEVLYFVTSYSSGGVGAWRCLQILPGKEPKFISISNIRKYIQE